MSGLSNLDSTQEMYQYFPIIQFVQIFDILFYEIKSF